MIFKIDIDGVLRDIVSTSCKVYNDEFGTDIRPADVIDYDFSKTFVKVKDHWFDYFFNEHLSEVMLNADPISGARNVLEILKKYGHTIMICTYQKEMWAKAYAIMWLDRCKIPYDSIVITSSHVKTGHPADVIIDDNPAVLAGADESCRICFTQPYNINCDEKCYEMRRDGWDDIINLFIYIP